MYFTNLRTHQSICTSGDEKQYFNFFIGTLLPWIIIFGILYFILETFDGWVRPFSNTIGYFIVTLIGIESVMDELLKKNDGNDLKEAIVSINKNKTMILNEFDHKLRRVDGEKNGK